MSLVNGVLHRNTSVMPVMLCFMRRFSSCGQCDIRCVSLSSAFLHRGHRVLLYFPFMLHFSGSILVRSLKMMAASSLGSCRYCSSFISCLNWFSLCSFLRALLSSWYLIFEVAWVFLVAIAFHLLLGVWRMSFIVKVILFFLRVLMICAAQVSWLPLYSVSCVFRTLCASVPSAWRIRHRNVSLQVFPRSWILPTR